MAVKTVANYSELVRQKVRVSTEKSQQVKIMPSDKIIFSALGATVAVTLGLLKQRESY
jgi:hypothetical protein